MRDMRRQSGNMLMLLLSVVGFAILIGFLVMNVNTLIGTHKQAQTAIDAAALQAAKDMARIVVDGPHGRMALVDDPSGDSKWPVTGVNTILATLRLDAIVADKLGNKTILYLVKNDLSQTEAAIKVLKSKIAASAAGGGGAFDRFGKPVNIKESALQAYQSNEVRLSGTSEAPKNFMVLVGRLKASPGQAGIGIPVPNPESIDSVAYGSTNSKLGTDHKKYYVADTDYPVAGLGTSIRFGFVGQQPALIENAAFVDAPGLDIPVLAQISVDQPVTKMVEMPQQGQKKVEYLNTIATAQVGNRNYLPPSGVLEVGFPGGIPPEDVQNGAPSFKSAKNIMNASQLDPASAQVGSSYSGWNKETPGQWFKAEGGPVWGSGSVTPAKFKGMDGRVHDDPSVALSFFVYDWLRSMHYRPNAQALIDALSTEFSQVAASAGSQRIFAGNPLDCLQPAYAQSTGPGITTGMVTIFPGADVDSFNNSPELIAAGQFQVIEVNGVRMPRMDPRNLNLWGTDVSAYQRQHARMWGYIPAEGALQPSVAMVKINPYSEWPETVDGNPLWHMTLYIRRLRQANSGAAIIYQAVSKIQKDALDGDDELRDLSASLSQEQKDSLAAQERSQTYDDMGYKGLAQESSQSAAGTPMPSPSILSRIRVRKQEVVGELYRKKPRVLAALINATYVMEVTSDMLRHMKTLTGIGVKLSGAELIALIDGKYEVGGATFWPPRSPWPISYSQGIVVHDNLYGRMVNIERLVDYVKSEIVKDDGKLPTYQDTAAPGEKDWCALPKKEGGKLVPSIVVYKRTSDPIIGAKVKGQGHLLPPALAQSAAPSNKFIFHYQIASDLTNNSPGEQKVIMVADRTSKFSSTPTSKGQVIYQTVAGLKAAIPTGGRECGKIAMKYQVQGRDLHANSYPENDSTTPSSPSASADYFSDGLVAAWAITCPVVDNSCPAPIAPEIDLVSRMFMDCTGHGGNWADFTFRGYPWIFTTIVDGDGSLETPWGVWPIRRYGGVFQYPDFPPAYIS